MIQNPSVAGSGSVETVKMIISGLAGTVYYTGPNGPEEISIRGSKVQITLLKDSLFFAEVDSSFLHFSYSDPNKYVYNDVNQKICCYAKEGATLTCTP